VSSGGAAEIDETEITVLNALPAVAPVIAPSDPIDIESQALFSAAFTDPGVLDTHTGVWDWGDGMTDSAAIVGSGGSGTASGSHAYAAAGIYGDHHGR
jgi:hypothetical protein